MTTETLKPFLSTSRRADSVTTMRLSTTSHCQPGFNFKRIIFGTFAVVFFLCLFGFMYVHFRRISQIEANVQHLTKKILKMQARLGLTNLDDLDDYGNEYDTVIIDQPKISQNGGGKLSQGDEQYTADVDYYENEFDYTEFRSQLPIMNFDEDEDDEAKNYIINDDSKGNDDGDDENVMEISDDSDLYEDFSKFNASRKNNTSFSARNPRAIESELFSKDDQKSKIIGLRKRADKSMDALNHPKNMVILRLPLLRKELSDGKHEENISPMEQKSSKQSQRRGMNHRRYKNSIVKKAKSARQIEAVANTPAAHFHLNHKIPDRFASIRIDSFSGDIYIGHPSWPNEIDVDKYFKVENGVLTVYETGLYYVYAQVCYNNTHDQNGFVIFHGHKPFLQCLNTVPTNMPHKIHTCHTSGLIYLKEHETIHLRDFHSDRNAILKESNNRSYFGLIKI
ncbi:protein eiger [Bactrocera neohumeralis]|uniref:protein eiger n=1 Tax=Bactrocera neohumeralis TaxID=98809 RepID=UPI002165D5FB|nr:protein eiger [Bactrocera neohumeralis]XP_050322319.1 protein eiger [Bactrocera neohumeralis]XP_050322320.1 protein eiger [Bactrocera neohumeralis]